MQLQKRQYLCRTNNMSMNQDLDYQNFISKKIVQSEKFGFTVPRENLHRTLFDHQKDTVLWMLEGGRRAGFLSFGLGKTRISIEILRQIVLREIGQKVLFIAPLGVRQEFTKKDGPAMGVNIKYCRNMEEVEAADTSFIITNYERVRDGQIDLSYFVAVSLDEASVLRSTGSLTFDAFLTAIEGVKYRFVFTATPSPNRYLELVNYAHFLGVMDRGQALTRFFGRNSTKAGDLRLYPHKEREFWLWLCSWSLMLYLPSDLGYENKGYDLPELKVFWHEIPADHEKAQAKTDENGQHYLLANEALGIIQGAQEKRDTIKDRVKKAREIFEEFGPENNWLMWHHLETEREAIEKEFKNSKSVFGRMELEEREQRVIDFSEGKIQILNTKPELSGSGCNFQRHCHQNIFVGVNYDFNDFIQAIHRTYRFLQENEVEVHIIYTEIERAIVAELRKKWQQHIELQENMRAVVSQHGLNNLSMIKALYRSSEVERLEESGENWTLVRNDCVTEWRNLPDNRFGLIVTSIPFSNHFEYTPSYLDFGHTDNDNHFFAQMDYLIPELLRTLQPGRIACIHVKDRIFYGSQTGTGFSTVNPFHAKTMFAFMQHGFEYMGMAVIPTDVVAENNQTYRLTYGEMVKDGTKMGFGSPEFLLVFRKPQSDTGRAYADVPVTKEREEYTLGRWQIDADALYKSNNRTLLDLKKLVRLANSEKGLGLVKKELERHFAKHGYDYKEHVAVADALADVGRLPKKFSLMQPPLTEGEKYLVWDDVVRMRTLNLNQVNAKREKHVCPLQLDIIERCVERYSNPGDEVADPFGGIGSTVFQSTKMGRKGFSTELNGDYWKDSTFYLRANDEVKKQLELF